MLPTLGKFDVENVCIVYVLTCLPNETPRNIFGTNNTSPETDVGVENWTRQITAFKFLGFQTLFSLFNLYLLEM